MGLNGKGGSGVTVNRVDLRVGFGFERWRMMFEQMAVETVGDRSR
jgi:hypothetical protein